MTRRDGWKVEIKKPRMCFTRFSYERYPAFRYVKDGKRAYLWRPQGFPRAKRSATRRRRAETAIR